MRKGYRFAIVFSVDKLYPGSDQSLVEHADGVEPRRSLSDGMAKPKLGRSVITGRDLVRWATPCR